MRSHQELGRGARRREVAQPAVELERPLAAEAKSPFSTTSIRWPAAARCWAALQPLMPPPTIRTSKFALSSLPRGDRVPDPLTDCGPRARNSLVYSWRHPLICS